MKNACLTFLIVCFFVLGANYIYASQYTIKIKGEVTNKLELSNLDLKNFDSVSVQFTDLTTYGGYNGTFVYRGVPLKTILKIAEIQYDTSIFDKPLDISILVKDIAGNKVVLSWGEVFYHNPEEVIIAYEGNPVIPHKNCKNCHEESFYKKYMVPLKRRIGFPKLVISKDFYSDRSLENIVEIKVISLPIKIKNTRLKNLFSPHIVLNLSQKNSVTISDLKNFSHKEYPVKILGEGKGYHGIFSFSGVSLVDILKKRGIRPDLSHIFLISAVDGYRCVLSAGEVFLSRYPGDIIIADRLNNSPIRKGGKFMLVLPNDLIVDRIVKAVKKIDVIDLSGY